ncbi:MAG: hypothetical protein ABSF88_07665 [Candidatus Aminicenantales bacterium]
MSLRRFLIPCFAMMALVPALLLGQEKPASDRVEAAAWITHVEGRAFFQNFEKAEADMAVKPGDELNTQKGRVEIEIGEGNWIRLDYNTRVVFTDIQKDSATLSLWEGSLYLHLKDQAVKVRSAQEEDLFQDKGLVRIDIDQNKTKIFKNPRVVDDFDGWSRSRDEALTSSEPEAGRYRSPWFYGGAFSPFWPGSPLDLYGGFYPYWSYWNSYLWSYYSWPSWYFGWNPFWFGNPGFYGYGSYFGGFYAGAYFRGGRPGDRVMRRDDIRRPRGLEGGSNRVLRPGSSTGNSATGIYPSRIPTRAIRPSSNSAGSRTASGTIRSGSLRSIAPRSFAGQGGRSFPGFSGSRSGGSSRGGGGRRR